MPNADPLSLHTASATHFVLPCPVLRALRYIGDPYVLLAAVPGIRRAVLRRGGMYRLTLAPVHAFNRRMHPVAEVTIIAHADAVCITSIPAIVQDPGQDEIPIALHATLGCASTADGCTVRVILAVDAVVPTHVVPPLLPHALVRRSLEPLLARRLQGEVETMADLLRGGYAAWVGPRDTRDL